MGSRSRDFHRGSAGRDFNASGFSIGNVGEEDFDPMRGTSNLTDAMLVFACGLLLALIVRYNVPIANHLTEATPTGEMTQIEDPGELTESTDDGGMGLQEMGTTYFDPQTGQYYVEIKE